jgi:hypothetical protein
VLDLGLWIAKLVKRLNGDPGPVGWEQGSFRAGAPEPTDLAGPGRCPPPLLLPSYLTAKGRHGSSNRRVIVGECVPSRGSTRDGNGSGSEDLKLRRPGQLRNMISPASSYVQDLFGRLLTRRMCALHDSTKPSQDRPPGTSTHPHHRSWKGSFKSPSLPLRYTRVSITLGIDGHSSRPWPPPARSKISIGRSSGRHWQTAAHSQTCWLSCGFWNPG